jgi:hypothetical protein
MVSNARFKLFLQVTLCNFMNLSIFLPMMGRDIFLSDNQYGRLHFLELSTGHGYQNGIQTGETEG